MHYITLILSKGLRQRVEENMGEKIKSKKMNFLGQNTTTSGIVLKKQALRQKTKLILNAFCSRQNYQVFAQTVSIIHLALPKTVVDSV